MSIILVTFRANISPNEPPRSEEHTSELQSQSNLVCRLLLEKKKNIELHYVHLVGKRHITTPHVDGDDVRPPHRLTDYVARAGEGPVLHQERSTVVANFHAVR